MCSRVCMRVSYLMQPSQSRLPVFSLMVLSEMKAGYSVSHGTCMVRPILWAGGSKGERGREKERKKKERNWVRKSWNIHFKVKYIFKIVMQIDCKQTHHILANIQVWKKAAFLNQSCLLSRWRYCQCKSRPAIYATLLELSCHPEVWNNAAGWRGGRRRNHRFGSIFLKQSY